MQATDEFRNLAYHRNIQAPRQDGGMALRPAMFNNDASKAIEVHGKQIHDRRLVGHQYQLVSAVVGSRRAWSQLPQNAAEDILDIVNAFLEKRIGQILERQSVFIKRLAEGILGRAAGRQAAGQVLLDRAVLHDHELTLQDRAVVLAHQSRDTLA